MGKFRSKSGCLTCRQRRVKCDEVKPLCGNCAKKNRDCQWETPQTKFRGYQPGSPSSSATALSETQEMNGVRGNDEVSVSEPTRRQSNHDLSVITAGQTVQVPVYPTGKATEGFQQPLTSPFLPQITSPASSLASGGVSVPSVFSAALPTEQPGHVPITRRDAKLVHHFAEHLGRWLDGTDSSRRFTLEVPDQVGRCSILLHAVGCFAARHLRDDAAAEEAYQACLALVIERLNLNTALHDVDLLCAIVILRFFEQLNVPTSSGADQEQHLAGTSAILRSSQTTTVDPSAPTLREAAFWVYVRQTLYNATITQQPPNIDFTLQLDPLPSAMTDNHPLARLGVETAWANQATWNCARVANFCFDRNHTAGPALRMQQWQQLWDSVESWKANRPLTFDPIWSGFDDDSDSQFPDMYFTADWHAVAFGYYHFCCILLLNYKPGPKFAMPFGRHKLSDVDNKVLEHARAICGSCKSSPECITNLITFCHTIFIWGPLLHNSAERLEVLSILANLELHQRWPTQWIVNALKLEWGN
ncbi:hypothetical protein PMIN07_008792 [Paraphaeosphaeria minitans]